MAFGMVLTNITPVCYWAQEAQIFQKEYLYRNHKLESVYAWIERSFLAVWHLTWVITPTILGVYFHSDHCNLAAPHDRQHSLEQNKCCFASLSVCGGQAVGVGGLFSWKLIDLYPLLLYTLPHVSESQCLSNRHGFIWVMSLLVRRLSMVPSLSKFTDPPRAFGSYLRGIIHVVMWQKCGVGCQCEPLVMEVAACRPPRCFYSYCPFSISESAVPHKVIRTEWTSGRKVKKGERDTLTRQGKGLRGYRQLYNEHHREFQVLLHLAYLLPCLLD